MPLSIFIFIVVLFLASVWLTFFWPTSIIIQSIDALLTKDLLIEIKNKYGYLEREKISKTIILFKKDVEFFFENDGLIYDSYNKTYKINFQKIETYKHFLRFFLLEDINDYELFKKDTKKYLRVKLLQKKMNEKYN